MNRRARQNVDYSISASTALTQSETRILKQGDTFAVLDPRGDIYFIGNDELGIYHRGTRFLSDFELRIGEDHLPMLLNSHLRDDNGLLNVELMSPDMKLSGGERLAKGLIHIQRDKFLLGSCCFEEILFQNFSDKEVRLPVSFHIGADYRDIFEVRGMRRPRHGEYLDRALAGRTLTLGYRGLDGVVRRTVVRFDFDVERVENERLCLTLVLAPKEKRVFEITASFSETQDTEACQGIPMASALANLSEAHHEGKQEYCEIETDSEPFNFWVERSRDDLVMMTTKTETGDAYPYAGIPWYCTPFGRDGIWTALLCLWANPSLARGVLQFLAKTQATEIEPEADATPGKIIHEVREGEMARLKEIPFGRYYGSVDSTPLFLYLAGEYFRRTADLDTIKSVWPHVERGLHWLEKYGDPDGDGFIEYAAQTPRGLAQQGWKDSHDSIFHADGSDAIGPIALCEVQGYVYAARVALSPLARLLGMRELASRLEREALELRERFEAKFWLPELGCYALALDGKKQPCRVRTSNAGQLLYTGLPSAERGATLARTLLTDEMFSGWGIRTVATEAYRYNPMSYHNGSVWPHDTAIIALGLARYGEYEAVERVCEGLYKAGSEMEFFRMPEVLCGFPRRPSGPPTLYPLACAPQAWASAVVYATVQALLGIDIDGTENRIQFRRPRLPAFLQELRLRDLRLGSSAIDAVVTRYQNDVGFCIEKRSGSAQIVVEH